MTFDGGAQIWGSSSPHVVPPPGSDASAIDPEELFVASIASCHMLWFLSIAAKRRVLVDRYFDKPEGIMERNGDGKLAVTVVTLRPKTVLAGNDLPTAEEIERFHAIAHEECFIANSVKTEIRIEPIVRWGGGK